MSPSANHVLQWGLLSVAAKSTWRRLRRRVSVGSAARNWPSKWTQCFSEDYKCRNHCSSPNHLVHSLKRPSLPRIAAHHLRRLSESKKPSERQTTLRV